jgi:exodeoxyribonuclease VII small subunit
MEKELSYTKAYTELQEIVAEIESSEVDIDQLDKKIRRASELLKICKDKLFKTEENVKTVLEEISNYDNQ